MKPSEIVRLLKKQGFVLWRDGAKHALYRRGETVVPVSHGTKTSHRSYLGTLQVLKKLGG